MYQDYLLSWGNFVEMLRLRKCFLYNLLPYTANEINQCLQQPTTEQIVTQFEKLFDEPLRPLKELLAHVVFYRTNNNEPVAKVLNQNGQLMHVFINKSTLFNVAEIESYEQYLKEHETDHIIVLFFGKMTAQTEAYQLHNDSHIEMFKYDYFSCVVGAHVLYNKENKKLNDEEKKKVLQSYSKNHFIPLPKNDAYARFYDWQIGDIIKIHRTYKEYTTICYRMVTKKQNNYSKLI